MQPISRALIVPGPPPTPSQFSALSLALSCAVLVPVCSPGWILLSGLLWLRWLRDSGRSIFLLSPAFTVPTPVICLWHLAALKQHHGSSEFQILLCFLHQCVHQLRGFPTAVLTSVCRECAAGGWRGCLEENPFVAAPGLVWGQPCYLQGWKIKSHPCEFKKGRLEREAQFPF